MSKADGIFIDMCSDIMENGTTTRDSASARTGRMARRRTPSSSSAYATDTTCVTSFCTHAAPHRAQERNGRGPVDIYQRKSKTSMTSNRTSGMTGG